MSGAVDGVALLPCPFCGGEARLYPVIIPFDADCDEIMIQCVECDAIGGNVLVDQDVHSQCDLQDLEAQAIAAWNTRTTPPARSYADAIEDAAKVADATAGKWVNGPARTIYGQAYQAACADIAAAIRLLSQGGKA